MNHDVTARRVTRALRGLYARQRLAVAAAPQPGAFECRIPAASGHYQHLERPAGQDWMARYLTGQLGLPVQITGVKYTRRTIRGPGNCVFAIQVCAAPGGLS